MANLTGFKKDNDGLFITKDPESNIQYGLDFTDYLTTGDSINGTPTVTITSPTGDADPLVHPTNAATDILVSNGKLVNIRLQGGTAGNVYNIRCKIVTSQGDTDARHFRIVCEDKTL